MSDWKPQNHIDLWKLPLTIVVTIFLLVISSKYLDLELESITHGDSSVRFRKEILQETLIQNLNIAEDMRNEIRDTTFEGNLKPPAEGDVKSLVVSDDIASRSFVQDGSKKVNVFNNVEGYIWLGNSSIGSKKINKSKLNGVETIDQVKIGEEYIVNGNMVLRANSPTNNVDYFKGEKQVGLAPKGSRVKVISEPLKKQLSDYTQYWVKVEILS